MTKSPAFQFNVDEYLADETVQMLSIAEEGILWRGLIDCGKNNDREAILSHKWIKRFIPAKEVSRREYISRKDRIYILSIGMCIRCCATEDIQVDHVIPVCKGGKSNRENLQPLCGRCNRKKGAHFDAF